MSLLVFFFVCVCLGFRSCDVCSMFAGAVFGHKVVSIAIATHYVWHVWESNKHRKKQKRTQQQQSKAKKKKKAHNQRTPNLSFPESNINGFTEFYAQTYTHSHTSIEVTARANCSIPARAMKYNRECSLVFFILLHSNTVVSPIRARESSVSVRFCCTFVSRIKIRCGKKEMNQIRVYGFTSPQSEFVSPGILLGWMNL